MRVVIFFVIVIKGRSVSTSEYSAVVSLEVGLFFCDRDLFFFGHRWHCLQVCCGQVSLETVAFVCIIRVVTTFWSARVQKEVRMFESDSPLKPTPSSGVCSRWNITS